MGKMWASAPDDWRAEPSLDSGKVKHSDDSASDVDADLLEIARRFEQAYSALGPTEPESTAAPDAELFPELPDVFEEPAPARAAAAESARVVQMLRREVEPAPSPSVREPEPNFADDVNLDEAMAILRASEERGATASRPAADAPRTARAAATARADMPAAAHAPGRSARRDKTVERAAPAPSSSDWATQSRVGRTLALAAAAVALVVGIGGGYLLAHGSKAKSGLIDSSPQGTHLRLDLSLPKR